MHAIEKIEKRKLIFSFIDKKIKIKSGIHWNQEEIMVCSLTIKKRITEDHNPDIVAHN